MGQQLLTISQLAKYVGVTVRAVRHYHALGLLPEPPRDSSGYRCYGATAVIELMRIKTLADAGVPLSRIKVLMQASPATFTHAINSVKADITKRIAELKATKARLDALQPGDRTFVSVAVAGYLDYLRQIGLSEAVIALERDAWILISALHPDYVDSWATQKQTILMQPDFKALYQQLDEARNWSTQDPRLEKLAQDMLHISNRYSDMEIPGQNELAADAQAMSLINEHGTHTFPPWKRLRELLRASQKRNR